MPINREVEDQITRIMGSYLLKGYTLLDRHCGDCQVFLQFVNTNVTNSWFRIQTPLMKTKTTNDYCIYCNEIIQKSNAFEEKTLLFNYIIETKKYK